jgi:hypothetical protein
MVLRALRSPVNEMTATRTARHAAPSPKVVHNALPPDGGKGWRRNDWLGLAVFGLAAVVTVVWLLILDRGDSFFYDEWDFINLAARTGYWHNVLQPHNGHPSMIPYSIYEALLHTVGLRHYGPYQWVLLLLNVGSGGLLFLLLRKKIHPVVAGALPAALMLLGPSWQDILWAFQIGFVGSVAGGLGALVLLDRRSRRADIGACLCLLASIACSGVGLAFLAGVGVELTWRRQTWRRLWIPAIPSVLFLVWYETVGKSSYSTFSLSSLGSLGRSAADSTAATVGALLGLGSTPGGVVTGILGVLAVVALVRSPGRSGRLAMALSGLLMFWVLTLATRGASQATPIRYFYPAAALVLVAVGELPSLIAREKKVRLPATAPSWARPVAILAMAGVLGYVGVAIWWNSDALRSGSSALSASDSQVRAEEGALDLAGSTLPPTYQPDPVEMPQVTVGPYARAASEFGSPGDSRRVIMASSESLRSSIDAWLLKGRPMVFSGPSAGRGFGACTRLPLGGGAPSPTFALPVQGAQITAPGDAALAVRVKSFASAYPASEVATLQPGSTTFMRWSTRPSDVRWQVQLTPIPVESAAGSFATVCS